MLDEHISQAEAQGHLVSGEYYKALTSNEKNNLAQLKKEKDAMLKELEVAMASGTITEGSEAWYDLCNSVNEVTLAIAESQTQLLEYEQTLQQLSWDVFDLLQDKLSAVSEEADFLIELLSSDKLFDDNGQLTDEGIATAGLHGQNYNSYMYQADLVAKEAEKLKKQLEEDQYDTELEERYREMIALQQEYILQAQQEKEAIRSLIEEGIEAEIEALEQRIEKYNEALESERSLYEYGEKIAEQTENIANIRKQLVSLQGDDSEESKSKRQQLENQLKDAEKELQQTEYDKYISDTQQMLDELSLQYSEILNARLDNLDALVADVIAEINADSAVIGDTIRETADSVGYTLSDSMETIWSSNTTNINGVITMYSEKFLSSQTITNNALNTINTNLQNVITQLNSIAKTKVESAKNSSATKSESSKTPEKSKEEKKSNTPSTQTEKKIKVGGKINAGSAKIYDYVGDKSGERQLYRKDPIYKVLDERNGYLLTRWHKLSNGYTGWFKKSDVKAYATGAKRIDADDMAWTQENGTEFIVRPSDGAILTPVAKNDKIFNAQASNNLWNMANTPAEFIKDNLKLDTSNVPNNSSVNHSVVQHFDNITFSMPNVHSYNEMLVQMQKDPKFDKLIQAMTLDKIAGKSSLAKGKSIR